MFRIGWPACAIVCVFALSCGSRSGERPASDKAATPLASAGASVAPNPTQTVVPPIVAPTTVSPEQIAPFNLYTVDSETGAITRLAEGIDFQSWLPDGRMVAASNDAVYLLDPRLEGVPKRLASGPVDSVSPDGRSVAFYSPGPSTVSVMPIDDPSAAVVLPAGGQVDSLKWSNDAQWLAIATLTANWQNVTVYVARASDLNDVRELGNARLYAWSPDSDRIALADGQGISVSDAASGTSAQLSLPTSILPMLAGLNPWDVWSGAFLAWSPDSKSLAFGGVGDFVVVPVAGAGGTEMSGARFHAWIPGTDTLAISGPSCMPEERLLVVTALGAVQRTFNDIYPYASAALPSPDGAYLAVSSFDLSNNKEGLKIVDTGSGEERTLVPATAVPLGWSADGRDIAVAGKEMGPFCPGRSGQTLNIHPVQ